MLYHNKIINSFSLFSHQHTNSHSSSHIISQIKLFNIITNLSLTATLQFIHFFSIFISPLVSSLFIASTLIITPTAPITLKTLKTANINMEIANCKPTQSNTNQNSANDHKNDSNYRARWQFHFFYFFTSFHSINVSNFIIWLYTIYACYIVRWEIYWVIILIVWVTIGYSWDILA